MTKTRKQISEALSVTQIIKPSRYFLQRLIVIIKDLKMLAIHKVKSHFILNKLKSLNP